VHKSHGWIHGSDHESTENGTPAVTARPPLVVTEPRPPHLLRRLGAIVYDTLLLLAVLFIAGMPLPLIPESIRFEPWVRHGTFVYLLLVSFAFFGWFWTHGGQTLGMRAWRIRITSHAGGPVSWKLAARRFVLALFSWAPAGLGFLWSLLDPDRRAWHDRLSGTRLVLVPRRSLPAQQKHSDAEEDQGR